MSKKGHIPIRRCVGCRKKKRQEDMMRLTQGSDGMMVVDEKRNLNGRGFYLCPDSGCLKMAQKNKKVRILWIDGSPVSFDIRMPLSVKDLTLGRKGNDKD